MHFFTIFLTLAVREDEPPFFHQAVPLYEGYTFEGKFPGSPRQRAYLAHFGVPFSISYPCRSSATQSSRHSVHTSGSASGSHSSVLAHPGGHSAALSKTSARSSGAGVTPSRSSSVTKHSSHPSSAPNITQIAWNPNPTLPPNAVSETFVHAGSTLVIPIPTKTTTILVVGTHVTVAPGGPVVNGLLPSGVSIVGAVKPTWNPNIAPPPGASSVTFTRPPSYTTVVTVPQASSAPPQNISGPPGDKNSRGEDWWLLLFGGVIGGLLPTDMAIVGGITPKPIPPVGWVGPPDVDEKVHFSNVIALEADFIALGEAVFNAHQFIRQAVVIQCRILVVGFVWKV
ncbi:hypothetical protein FB45DRAFT_1038232 [Roridomyces roridus]|uniref:Uncharacterized protein n=1 Tax=Roridomyces roridus TaxID=1738132 RepID=A0AAD7FBB9_9AGAR|nr:hypothetical protein FB45DRAFT_1038232 [Roridomyces roridus]